MTSPLSCLRCQGNPAECPGYPKCLSAGAVFWTSRPPSPQWQPSLETLEFMQAHMGTRTTPSGDLQVAMPESGVELARLVEAAIEHGRRIPTHPFTSELAPRERFDLLEIDAPEEDEAR